MAGRIGVDPPEIHAVVQAGRAARDGDGMRRLEIVHLDVKVELLRPFRVGPARRPVVGRALKAQHQAGIQVQGRPVVVDPQRGSGSLTRPPSTD